jgi:phytoene synthase
VALGKLNWWAEELSGAAASGGRHPLSQVLFDDERAHAIPAERWLAPVLAAMSQLEEGTAADFPAQLAAAGRLHGTLAALETAWWYGAAAVPERAARVAVLSHLLYALRRLEDDAERDRLPLPMAQLARHSLARTGLRQRSAARDEAVKAQLADLHSAWRESARLPGPLSVFRALESREAERLLRRARVAGDPLAVLQQGGRAGFGATFTAWRAARRWHGTTD